MADFLLLSRFSVPLPSFAHYCRFCCFVLCILLPPLTAQAQARQQNSAYDSLTAAASSGSYSVGSPPLTAPSGAAGAVRRCVMQFYHWTLICDTVLAAKKQVCNVSQAIYNAQNSMIFSWSVAASESGKPFLLLRAAHDADTAMPLELTVAGMDKPIAVDFIGCDNSVCLAQTAIDAALTKAIGRQSNVTLAYRSRSGSERMFESSFLGLREAVASIK